MTREAALRIRLCVAALLVAAGAWIGLGAALAQDAPDPAAPPAPGVAPRGPDSPRVLFNEFLRACNDELKRGRIGRLRDAAALLDLSGIPEAERPAEGLRLARTLKAVLDFHGRVDVDRLPDRAEIGDRTTYTVETDQGAVTAVTLDGRWVFSAGTLSRVDAMREGFVAAGADRYSVFSLRERMPATLRGRALGLEHWQWLGLVSLFLASWIAHRIVIFFVHHGLGFALRRRGWTENAAKAADRASRPVGFFAVSLIVVAATPYLELPLRPFDLEKLSILVGKFFASLAAVMLCYGLADVVGARLREAAGRTDSRLDDQLVPLIVKSLKVLVTAGGVLFILDNLEVDVVSLLAGLGVAGLGIAFAAKDTIANLFGSITVFLDRPFQVGDWVQVAGVDGTVEEVGFRSTRVRTFQDSLVSIPNANLVDSPVDNLGRRTFRRYRTILGVKYDTPAETLEAFCEGIRRIVHANPNMRHEKFFVVVHDFGASAIEILVYVFFRVPDWASELRERQNFIVEVVRLARSMGVEFAFPTRTLHLESSPERPPAAPPDRPVDELDAAARRFGKDGDLSRPGGTERFSTAPKRPA